MNVKFLKIFIIGAFLAFAACAFFVSGGDKIEAQSNQAVIRENAGILEKVAAYKTWKQINKPGNETKTDTTLIINSTGMG